MADRRPHWRGKARPELRRPPQDEVAIYRIRVDLDHAEPPIWRRLDLRSDLPLDVVHQVLQVAFSTGPTPTCTGSPSAGTGLDHGDRGRSPSRIPENGAVRDGGDRRSPTASPDRDARRSHGVGQAHPSRPRKNVTWDHRGTGNARAEGAVASEPQPHDQTGLVSASPSAAPSGHRPSG